MTSGWISDWLHNSLGFLQFEFAHENFKKEVLNPRIKAKINLYLTFSWEVLQFTRCYFALYNHILELIDIC